MPYQLEAVDADEYFHGTDYEILGNQQRYGVSSGCAVTYDVADMTIDIAAGAILHNGKPVTVAAARNALTLVADGSNERWSYITLDSAGSAVLVSGDAAANGSTEPTKPDLGDRVILAMVKIQAGQTRANDAEFKLDKRIPTQGGVNVWKAADETVNSSVIRQNDDDLLFAVGANEVWIGTMLLYVVTALGPDFKYAFTFPAGATFIAFSIAGATNDLATADVLTSSGGGVSLTLSGSYVIQVGFTIRVGATAGNVQLQWAQNVPSTIATTVKDGSHLVAKLVSWQEAS